MVHKDSESPGFEPWLSPLSKTPFTQISEAISSERESQSQVVVKIKYNVRPLHGASI